ncbi:MAG: hypothetical protein H0X31_16525 [Nostocaceae cyanobacterium]|nr:hypothetical protein [Nostocaceae cyanobacterium]
MVSKPSDTLFWQTKVLGLLHDPALKALRSNAGGSGNSFREDLVVMQDWKNNGWNPKAEKQPALLQHIHLADFITSENRQC